MKQARASHAEWEALIAWFNAREDAGEPCPEWRRVVFGYDVLFTNAGDPAKDYLDWKPGQSPGEVMCLRSALERIAEQKLSAEIGDSDAADYVVGYDECIRHARDAVRP